MWGDIVTFICFVFFLLVLYYIVHCKNKTVDRSVLLCSSTSRGDRQTETDRDRDIETETEKQTEKQRERQRNRDRQTARHRDRETQ